MKYLKNTGLARLDHLEWNLVKATLLFAGYLSRRESKAGHSELWTPDGLKCVSQREDQGASHYLEAACLKDCPNTPWAMETYRLWLEESKYDGIIG